MFTKPFAVATHKHIAELIIKHRRNTLSAQENEELNAWCNLCEENQLLFERLSGPGYDNMVELYNSLSITETGGKVRSLFPDQRRKRFITALVYAVIVMCLLFTAVAVNSIFNKEKERYKKNELVQQQA